MEMMYLLIPGTVFLLVLTIKIFYWGVNSGQFDDLETEGHRILFDDDAPQEKTAANTAAGELLRNSVASDSQSSDPVVKSRQ